MTAQIQEQTAENKAYRRLIITPPIMGEIAMKFWEKRHLFPHGIGSEPERLAAILTAPDTAVFEIGDFAGILYFTEVMPGPEVGEHQEATAQAHIFIWAKEYLGKPNIIRMLCLDFMRAFEIVRLYCEIPISNRPAALAAESVGFKHIGIMRQRIPTPDGRKDSYLMDALPEDFIKAGGG